MLAAVLGMGAAAGEAQNINFPNFCSTSSFTLNGDAAPLNPNPECRLRLTNDLGQGSSAFLTNTFSLAADASFSTVFQFQFTNPLGIGDDDGIGADGIVFTVQTVSNTAGAGGGGIGYQGISPSVGIEFDTFNNGAQDQNNGNHVGIDINGDVTSIALIPFLPRFNNGAVWTGWVDYNGVTKVLEVRVNQTGSRPVNPTLQAVVNLPVVLGTTNAFVGFTSGTGSGGNTHEILSWQMAPVFAPFGTQNVVVPTLSYPVLALLALALMGTALFLLKS
jgi:hypothetical protein